MHSSLGSRATVRLGVVLSGGGLRGAAHLGVLRGVLGLGATIDVMVGVSAGAIVAGLYAGAGIGIDDLIDDVSTLRGRHVLMHGLTLRAPESARAVLRRFCGRIPERLRQLEPARFDALHHGIGRLGIVCHDLVSNRPVYFSTVGHFGVPLSLTVRGSAAVPRLIPPRRVVVDGKRAHLVDGGISDPLPCDFAISTLGATHLIVSDCRRTPGPAPTGPSIVYVRPELHGTAVLRSPAATLADTVKKGEAAWTHDMIDTIRGWMALRGDADAHSTTHAETARLAR